MKTLNALLTAFGFILLLTALTSNLATGAYDLFSQSAEPAQLAKDFLVNAHPTWMTKMLFASFFFIASGIVMEAMRRAWGGILLPTN